MCSYSMKIEHNWIKWDNPFNNAATLWPTFNPTGRLNSLSHNGHLWIVKLWMNRMCFANALRFGDIFGQCGHCIGTWAIFSWTVLMCLRRYCSFLYDRPHIWQLDLGSPLCSFRCRCRLCFDRYWAAQMWHTFWSCCSWTTATWDLSRFFESKLYAKFKRVI